MQTDRHVATARLHRCATADTSTVNVNQKVQLFYYRPVGQYKSYVGQMEYGIAPGRRLRRGLWDICTQLCGACLVKVWDRGVL